MCDGYHAADADDHPNLEDEFLCEYVDGTMDPVVREVFEEYVRTDPDLQEHIKCLRNTRLLLCRYGCRCHAPHDLHDRLRREITCELVSGRVPFHIVVADRLKGIATVSSAMVILLFVGFLGGVSVIETSDGHAPVMSTAVISVQDLGPETTTSSVDREPRSPLQSPPLSPKEPRVLDAAEPLVVRGLEHELHGGSRAPYAVALEHSSVYP